MSAITGNPIRDVATAIKNMIQGKGAIVRHSHRALDGGLISTDGTITITNALQRPLLVDSEMLIEHLNPELWSGHRFYIGKTTPTIKLNYPLAIGDLWLNTTSYNSYVLNFYDGHQWVAIGSQASVLSGSGAAGEVTFWTSPAVLSGDFALFWDNVNKKLGIGTNAPVAALDIFRTTAGAGLRVTNSSANASTIAIDNVAGQQSVVDFRDGGTSKFQFGKQTDNTFFMYDSVNAANFIYANPATKISGFDTSAVGYKFGFGNVNPGKTVDVTGDLRASASITDSAITGNSTVVSSAGGLLTGIASGADGAYFRTKAAATPTFTFDSKIQTETGAALPGAGNAGRLYQRTSDNTLWFDTGVSWVQA